MTLPVPQPALLVRYSYLWWDQAKAGADNGRKDRPVVVVLVVLNAQGKPTVLVAPVTHTQPKSKDDGVEIPASTKKRLGLDDQPSWIVTTEVNQFEWPGPDLRPADPTDPSEFSFGFIPAKLFTAVIEQIRANARTVAGRTVPRSR